tara:strand:+ start:9047 stop:9334 length:288 start_codon:yes stop_codon:yes gene_type:complete
VFYAFGVNQYNIKGQANDHKCDSLHAEVDCVNRLKKMEKPTDINLVVFRTNNYGNSMMMSKPCNNCLKTIDVVLSKKNYKLKRLYYTNNNSIIKM